MDLAVGKAIVIAGLFFIPFFFSLLPIKLMKSMRRTIDPSRRRLYKCMISLLSCFAGGVFLGTGLLHLLPEVDDKMSEISDKLNLDFQYPVAEALMVFGFLIMLSVEQIVLAYKESEEFDEYRNPLLGNQRSGYRPIGESEHSQPNGELTGIHSEPQTPTTSGDWSQPSVSLDESFDAMAQSVHEDPSSHSSLRSFILLIALSLHSSFEGVAIGLQPTMTETVGIFLAVMMHKVILAFSLGMNLCQSRLKLFHIILSNFIFSVASPLGSVIGTFIVEQGESIETIIADGILQGIACGTFLYVTFFEVLPHEFNKPQFRLGKLSLLIIGFSTVCGLKFLDPD